MLLIQAWLSSNFTNYTIIMCRVRIPLISNYYKTETCVGLRKIEFCITINIEERNVIRKFHLRPKKNVFFFKIKKAKKRHQTRF